MASKDEMLKTVHTLNEEVKTIFDTNEGELDSSTWEKVKTNNKEIERIEKLIASAIEQEDARKSAAERGRLPGPAAQQAKAEKSAVKTLGEAIIADPEFAAWRAKVSPAAGHVSRNAFGNSPAFNVGAGVKTLLTGASATSAGALAYPQFLGVQDMGVSMRPLTIRDLITTGTTDTDTVEYVRVGTFTNAAAGVAEASATSGASGEKPESALALSVVTETVKTIAHWIPATRRALSDASQIRTYIDQFLRYGLEEKLNDQMLTGDGVGENFTGIMNTTGTTTQAWSTNILTTTRKARTAVRVTGRATPTAYVLHPTDWETIDLLQDNEARYYFGGPSVLGTPRLWGLPVVEDEGMTQGYGICADWKLAVLWDRQLTQILVSDSHSDFFIRNMIAILAELRAAFTVLRPAAFVEIDLTA